LPRSSAAGSANERACPPRRFACVAGARDGGRRARLDPLPRILRGQHPQPAGLAELEAPIARLTGRGARAIVVAGMSVGGLAALAFSARRSGLAGIIALAPNGSPEQLVRLSGYCRGTSNRDFDSSDTASFAINLRQSSPLGRGGNPYRPFSQHHAPSEGVLPSKE
jgi:hypothetical protein